MTGPISFAISTTGKSCSAVHWQLWRWDATHWYRIYQSCFNRRERHFNVSRLPAEIRASAGSIAGVSGFQLYFSSFEIYTPGDDPNVLVTMNPAALKANIADLLSGGTCIVNIGTFAKSNLKKAGYNPVEDDAILSKYEVRLVDINKLVNTALAETSLTFKEMGRCKTYFALGLDVLAIRKSSRTARSQYPRGIPA